MQAIDRTHRKSCLNSLFVLRSDLTCCLHYKNIKSFLFFSGLGQYRPIRAVRFIAEGTVEERVLQLQEKKRLVFDGTVGRDAASLKMLTVDDMKALFT